MREHLAKGDLPISKCRQQGLFVLEGKGFERGVNFPLLAQTGEVEMMTSQFAFEQFASQGNTTIMLLGFEPLANPVLRLGRSHHFQPVFIGGLLR